MNLLWAAWIEYERDRAMYLGVAMIYYAIVSLVPLLSLALSTLGLLLRFSSAAAEFQRQTMAALEANFGPRLREMIEPLIETLEQESIIGTVISLAGLLMAASVLFHHLRMSFRAIWRYDPPLIGASVHAVVKTTILERAFSVGLMLSGGALLITALGVNAAIQWLDRLLGSFSLFGQGTLLGIVSSSIFNILTFAFLFKFLPPTPIPFRHVWPAALLCAFSWVAASKILSLYGVFFGNNRSAYGALAGLLVVLIWMNLVSKILFFGAELCKVSLERAEASIPSTSEPPPGEPYPI